MGGFLIALPALGFFTVADDLRHTGELGAVLGIAISGVALFLAGHFSQLSATLSLQWTPVGIALGMCCGLAFDRVLLGVVFGVGMGMALSYLRRSRSPALQ